MSHTASPRWRLHEHEVLPSTQDVAIEAARAGADHVAVLARVQSAGRGSHGRSWDAPEGNLNLSMVLRPDIGSPQGGTWSLLAGVVLHEAVTSLVEDASGIILKWPNDVLRGGAKLGGILIDSEVGEDGRLDWVVIGMGVNIAHAPVIPGRETADLGGCVTANALAHAVMGRLDAWLAGGCEGLREAWLARAHPAGTMLRVRQPNFMQDGIFAGLSERGELLLQGRSAPISAAEVELRNQGSGAPGPSLSPPSSNGAEPWPSFEPRCS